MRERQRQASGANDHSCEYGGNELEHVFVLGRMATCGLAPEHPCEESAAGFTGVTFAALSLGHAAQHVFDVATATSPTHLAAFPATNRSAHGNCPYLLYISHMRILDIVNIDDGALAVLRRMAVHRQA